MRRSSGPAFILLAALPAAAASGQTVPASASGGEAASGALEEVVVTAQRRSEDIQKSSLEIQSVSATEIASAGVTQAKDLNALVPGLQISQGGSATQIFMRGVGDISSSELSNPGVAFNVDGVYVGRPEAVTSTFYDIQRVEVLKGPQGTLYGRNTSGGAINVITNQPSLSEGVAGYVSFEGGNYALKHGDGAINIPITADLAIRAAFDVVDRNGYLSDGSDDDKHEAGRIHLLWQPSDKFSLLATVDYAHVHGEGAGYALGSYGLNPLPPGTDPWTAGNSPLGLKGLGSVPPFSFVPPFCGAPVLVCGMSFTPSVENQAVNESLEAKYDFGWATLTVLPAYRDWHDNEHGFPGFSNTQIFDSRESTVEARLNHNDESLKWVAGLYYYGERIDGRALIDQGVVQQSTYTYNTNATDAYAAFGQATYSIRKDLRLIAGVRYTDERHSLDGGADTTSLTTTGFVHITEPFFGAQKFNNTTWKTGFEYDIAPSNMIYFTAGTGFKAGGLNQEPPPNVYQPETLTAYEFGSRNRFFDDRLQINAELFKWDYRNLQVGTITFDTTGAPNFIIENAAAVAIEGASLDIAAKPSPYDTFRVYGEYNHARYNSYAVNDAVFAYSPAATPCPAGAPHLVGGLPVVTVDCSGYQLARAPLWTGSTSWQHEFPLPSGARLIANASARFASSRWGTIDFTPYERLPAYAQGNVDLSYESPDRRWIVGAYVHNLSNVAVASDAVQQGFAPPQLYYTLNSPRTFGGRVTVNF